MTPLKRPRLSPVALWHEAVLTARVLWLVLRTYPYGAVGVNPGVNPGVNGRWALLEALSDGVRCAGRLFERFSDAVNRVVGTPAAFVAALTVILVWAMSGPLFHFSDTWQLVINTGTTIVTFLIGFAIANQNNRSARHDHTAMETLNRLEQEHGDHLAQLTRQLALLEQINRQQLDILTAPPQSPQSPQSPPSSS